MKTLLAPAPTTFVASLLLAGVGFAEEPTTKPDSTRAGIVTPAEAKKADAEIDARYAAAAPEVQEYVRWTASAFGSAGLWLNEDAFDSLSAAEREKKIAYLVSLFADAD